MTRILASIATLSALVLACAQGPGDRAPFPTGDGAGDGSDGADDPGDDGDGDEEKLDTLGEPGEANPCGEGEDCEQDCVEVEHTPCDDDTEDLFNAMGLNCPGELPVTGTSDGHPDGMDVIPGFGPTEQWDPTEGSAVAVIGTGYTAELFMETPNGDAISCPTHCNDDFDQVILSCSDPMKNVLNAHDPGMDLPPPSKVNDVAGDCTTDPGLLGTGDCSNTIQGQFSQGVNAHDYTEMRIVVTVPEDVTSFSYDFAFFSTEYPYYYFSEFNDIYVAWLESDYWTGNISFDEVGNPISLNAGFLDFRDDAGTLPEFEGTCMRQHAGTKWLTTTAPVASGDEITVVFAIFDLSDSILDSYTLLDNWQWGCEGPDRPDTKPVG